MKGWGRGKTFDSASLSWRNPLTDLCILAHNDKWVCNFPPDWGATKHISTFPRWAVRVQSSSIVLFTQALHTYSLTLAFCSSYGQNRRLHSPWSIKTNRQSLTSHSEVICWWREEGLFFLHHIFTTTPKFRGSVVLVRKMFFFSFCASWIAMNLCHLDCWACAGTVHLCVHYWHFRRRWHTCCFVLELSLFSCYILTGLFVAFVATDMKMTWHWLKFWLHMSKNIFYICSEDA